jgi:hypothetical protein
MRPSDTVAYHETDAADPGWVALAAITQTNGVVRQFVVAAFCCAAWGG